MTPDPQAHVPADGLSPEQAELYHRIAGHPFDRAAPLEHFSAKLARQNGWSPAYARRVTAEYRRFVLIALESGHVASPSDAVDQAWHLHLGHTRDYWERFCPAVLGRPLHHEPGSRAEAARHAALYRQTLASYRRLFGEAPPADIWPAEPACQRFQRVDLAQHLLLPRPFSQAARSRYAGLGAAAALLTLAGCSALGSLDVLDYSGPTFLAFYIAVLAIYLLLRPWLRSLGEPRATPVLAKLDPLEAAYLADGPARLVDTVVLSLLQKQQLLMDDQGRLNRTSLASELGLAPFERAVLAQIGHDTLPSQLPARVGPGIAAFRQALTERGLLRRPGLDRVDWIGVGLWLLGAAKLAVGLSRGRPVGLLLLVLGLLTVTGIALFVQSRRIRQSSTGRAALGGYDRHTRKLARGSDDYALQRFALVGSAALAGSAWAIFQRHFGLLPPGRQDGGSDNGSSSSNNDSTCSSGSGDGGGGCGGCGGGGD